jgi:thermolabile hemolysin
MRIICHCLSLLFWLRLVTLDAWAGFSSLYVFGDSLSAVTGAGYQYPPPPGTSAANYWNGRFSNGRVWVEYLAAEQGMAFSTNNVFAFFDNTAEQVLNDVIYGNYYPPPDAATSLFILWSACSDCFANAFQYGTDGAAWNLGTSNAMQAVGSTVDWLYGQGVRTMVIPNSVDISVVPFFTYTLTNLYGSTNDVGPTLAGIRDQVQRFNTALASQITQSLATHPDLTIWSTDFYGQFNFLLTHPSIYGVTKLNIDALEDPALGDKSFTGPGADYMFWDYLHPTTKVHAAIANFVQQIIAPLRITRFTQAGATNWFDLSNLPIGRTGTLESTTNLLDPATWTSCASITVTGATQTVSILTNGLGSPCFFRLNFPP